MPPQTPATHAVVGALRRRGRDIAVIVRRASPRPGRRRRGRRARASARRAAPAGSCRSTSWPSSSLAEHLAVAPVDVALDAHRTPCGTMTCRSPTPTRLHRRGLAGAAARACRGRARARRRRACSRRRAPAAVVGRVAAVADAVVEAGRRSSRRRSPRAPSSERRSRPARRRAGAGTRRRRRRRRPRPRRPRARSPRGCRRPQRRARRAIPAATTSTPSTAVVSGNDAPARRGGGRPSARPARGRRGATSLGRGAEREQRDPGDEHEHPGEVAVGQKRACERSTIAGDGDEREPEQPPGPLAVVAERLLDDRLVAALVGDHERARRSRSGSPRRRAARARRTRRGRSAGLTSK